MRPGQLRALGASSSKQDGADQAVLSPIRDCGPAHLTIYVFARRYRLTSPRAHSHIPVVLPKRIDKY